MAPMPTSTSTTATTTSTSLDPEIDNGVGVTSSYNYTSATVPVAHQTQTIAPALDNYTTSTVQNMAGSQPTNNLTLLNSSSISSSLVQPNNYSMPYWDTTVTPVAYNTTNFTSTNLSPNTSNPVPNQHSSMLLLPSQQRYAHYIASINSAITNVMNNINNTQQQLNATSMPVASSSSAFATPITVAPSSSAFAAPMPVATSSSAFATPTKRAHSTKQKAEKKPKSKSNTAKLLKTHVPTTSARTAAAYNPFASTSAGSFHFPSNATATLYFPRTYVPGSSYVGPAATYVPVSTTTNDSQDLFTATLTSCLPLPPSTSPPLPPNWNQHLEDTVISLVPYKLFPVDSNTAEYTTLAELMSPLNIIVAEQVVNPTLWSRFVNTRKDMLRSKTENLQLLSKLGLDEEEVMRSAHFSLNFNKDPSVEAYPYTDNMALLFHCTRSIANVENILVQGLDERVGDTSGLLGRGIYFADDPNKSIQYDRCGGVMFIFAVLLGDCLSVDHVANKNTFVREPPKEQMQKRNFNDLTFDSIVARPTNINSEYVVYNRYQCCPLYKIKYNRSQANVNFGRTNIYCQYRNKVPSFSWVPPTDRASVAPLPNPLANTGWPFYASAIFSEMGVVQKVEDVPQTPVATTESIDAKLAIMLNLGFTDADENLETLKKYEYDLDRSVNYLLDQSAESNEQWEPTPIFEENPMIDLTYSPESTPNSSQHNVYTLSEVEPKTEMSFDNADIASEEEVMIQDIFDWVVNSEDVVASEDAVASEDVVASTSSTEQQLEECNICCNEYETSATYWTTLECSHKVCNACYKQIETTRTTMAGVSHTFVKCPFCQGTTGIEIGTCPDGTMTVVFWAQRAKVMNNTIQYQSDTLCQVIS